MDKSKVGRFGLENKMAKDMPCARRVVTRADARARTALGDVGNIVGGQPAKPKGAEAAKAEKFKKPTQIVDKPRLRKSGVSLTEKSGTTRASTATLKVHPDKNAKGQTRPNLLLGNGKPVSSRVLNVNGLRKSVAPATGKPQRSSSVHMSGEGASKTVCLPNAGIVSSSESADQPSIAGDHISGSGKPPRASIINVPRRRPSSLVLLKKPSITSASGKPLRPSNVNVSSKVVPSTAKQMVCPPKGKVVSSRIETTDSSKRRAKLQRAFTSTLTARSEAALGHSGPENIEAERDLPDIDEADNENQLAVADYVHDIYQFYWDTEARKCPSSSYMSSQIDVSQKMRGILVDWLIDVHQKFELMPETLFLMTNLIDRFLSVHVIARKDLQLVGLTALLLAAKYEEIWPPKVDDLIEISKNSYTREQVLSMEKLMVNKLRFHLTVPTPYVFIKRFLKAAQAEEKLEKLSFYLVELCLVEYESLKWQPSMLAASTIYVAQQNLQKSPPWTRLLRKHARYTESELKECASMIVRFHKRADKNDLKVVYEKYSSSESGSVAKLPYITTLPSGV